MLLFRALTNLFFPETCPGCSGMLTDQESVICTACRHELPLTQFHLNPENEAFRKFYGRLSIEHASALLYYHKNGIAQRLIHSLKYKGRQEIGTVLGQWYAEELKEAKVLKSIDAIVPVPLHPKRLKERGYNQVRLFGLALSEILEVPYRDEILIKERYSKTQSKKSFLDRTQISKDAMAIRFDQSDHGKHFLLIDDVLTTGTTLESCGREILKIPASKLSIITMAMSHP